MVNLFAFLGDMCHLTAILLLPYKLHTSRSAAGVSLKMQELYLLVFVTRYLDLINFNRFHTLYNSGLKVTYITLKVISIWMMRRRPSLKASYDRSLDWFRPLAHGVIPCLVLTLAITTWDRLQGCTCPSWAHTERSTSPTGWRGSPPQGSAYAIRSCTRWTSYKPRFSWSSSWTGDSEFLATCPPKSWTVSTSWGPTLPPGSACSRTRTRTGPTSKPTPAPTAKSTTAAAAAGAAAAAKGRLPPPATVPRRAPKHETKGGALGYHSGAGGDGREKAAARP
ncbi:unnamed protein product [Scytosiphon promiscuus]